MSFLLKCPNCGSRSVNDYRYGGEVTARPSPGDSEETWSAYFYVRKNAAGLQREWWYHKYGCRRWFQAERNTLNNERVGDVLAGRRARAKPSGDEEMKWQSEGFRPIHPRS